MFSEILSSPVAWFVTIILIIHISILVFMGRQKLKREAENVKRLQSELRDSENQIQRLFDTMDDNRRILTESLRELAAIENELDQEAAEAEEDSDKDVETT